jgi:hypothetical protein
MSDLPDMTPRYEEADPELMAEARRLIELSKAGDAEATSMLWAMIDGPIVNEATELIEAYLKTKGANL